MLTRTYRKWDSMLGRCYRPSHPAYRYYGARGITVCDRWRSSYENFLEDMGEAPAGLWLDRIDGSKPYQPGNCRWVTPKESAANRRKTGPAINPNSIRQRALAAGLPYMLVINRTRLGWPIDKALSVPIQKPGAMTHYDKHRLGLGT